MNFFFEIVVSEYLTYWKISNTAIFGWRQDAYLYMYVCAGDRSMAFETTIVRMTINPIVYI